VHPYRRTIFLSEPFPMPDRFPVILDIHAGWTLIREGGGARISGQTDSRPSFDRSVDWAHLAISAEHAVHRYPPLRDARFGKRGYAGTYDTTPDNHGIIGEAPDVAGLYLCCGFSGHGFQHSPAAGRVTAELVLDGAARGIDIVPLALTRFRDGTSLWEPLTAYAGSHVRSNA
jgi:sarcosine oxidase, subunit beta